MPISSCPNSSKRDQGFTLIEILVVLFIVTILTGLVITRLPAFGSDADFDLEASRLHLLLRMARSEAVLESTEFGFRQTDNGYAFLRFDDEKQDWVSAESPFHARQLDSDIRMILSADNDGYDALGEDIPTLLILSSGETTPFRITLESKGRSLKKVLATDGYEEIAWRDDE